MLNNGSALSQAGTASIAMMASLNHIPVLFLCETYKFTSKVRLDSICDNEFGDKDLNLSDEIKNIIFPKYFIFILVLKYYH